jgi:protein involved in polysaccharide export with SLBB domain
MRPGFSFLLMSLLMVGLATSLRSSQNNAARAQKPPEDSKSESSAATRSLAAKKAGETPRPSSDAKKYYELGVKYGRAKLYKDAAASFLQAVRLQPNYADAYYGLGHAYYDMGRWREAIDAYEKVVHLDPKDDEAYARLGEIYSKLKTEGNTPSKVQASSPASEKVNVIISPAPQAVRATAKTSEATSPQLTEIYRMGIGDVLDVRLRDSAAAESTLFTVAPNGFLDYPILHGPLKVAGLTAQEVSKNLEAGLKRLGVRENPEVVVGVREYNSHTILISGLVKESGTKILRREAIPLYVVIADAQPLPEAGRVSIISYLTGQTITVDLADPNLTKLLIHPGDVLTFRSAPMLFFYAGGEVKVPGEKPYRSGLTLTQAILSAGGVTKKGKKVEVARAQTNGLLGVNMYNLKDINLGKAPDPPVQSGDRITVVH